MIFNLYLSFTIITFFASLPLSIWMVLAIHEIMHALAFFAFGFPIKELRIGLLLIQFKKPWIRIRIESTGFFRGYCTADINKTKKWKTIVALLAGGLSGLLISLTSFAFLIGKVVSAKWDALLVANILCGWYSFVVSLVNPTGKDRKLIERLVNTHF